MQEVQIKPDFTDNNESFFFNIMDAKFAPLKTFTNDYEWRNELKVGELIDCVDNEFDWYKGIILEVADKSVKGQEPEDKENPGKMVYIGYRNYTEEGNKMDEMGKFYGWTCKYDEWKDVYDPRIQKYSTIFYDYTRVDVKNHSALHKQDDKSDIMSQNAKPAYMAACREKVFAKSNTIVDALNQVNDAGVF